MSLFQYISEVSIGVEILEFLHSNLIFINLALCTGYCHNGIGLKGNVKAKVCKDILIMFFQLKLCGSSLGN